MTKLPPPPATQDTTTEYPHIVRRPDIVGGRPRIAGTRIPVWQIASRWQMDETLGDILNAYPHVPAAAVHSALAYYWDHKAAVDAEIAENRPEQVWVALHGGPKHAKAPAGTVDDAADQPGTPRP